jgi:hypothetical protein
MTCEKVALLCTTGMVVLVLIRVTAYYPKIQDGIASASPGDSAQVSPRTSQEKLCISETLTLVEKTSTTSL